MNPTLTAVAVSLVFGTSYALADTTSSDQDKATMERKASPSSDTKQDEEQAEAHGQPDSQTSSNSPSQDSASSSSGASSGEDQSKAAQTQKPTSGDYYQSNENKADSTKSQQ